MLNTLALIKRRPDTERSTFRDHYENEHVPLALPLLDGLRRYVRYHVECDLFGAFPFDVLTSFGYRDKAATDRVFANLEGEAGLAIRADELQFMDKPANTFFAVSERSLLSGDEDETNLFVAVSRPSGMSRFDASTNLVKDHFPGLMARLEEPSLALLRDAFPMLGNEPPYDCFLQVVAAETDDAAVEGWAKGVQAEGYAVCVFVTRRLETVLD